MAGKCCCCPGPFGATAEGTGAAPARLQHLVSVHRSKLSFEGGDIIAGRRTVLLGAISLARTMSDLSLSREAGAR